MDGFQVMENLKEIETGGYLPVLVITAQPDHKLRALKAGAKDFVSKPFDLAEVLIRVRNMLEVRLLHMELKQLYERVVAEQKVSEQLLLKVLPSSLAEHFLEPPEATPPGSPERISESFAEVAVLFTGIVEFTKFAKGANAEVLRGVLSDIATRSDILAGTPVGLDRTRTIGDAYLASVGLAGPEADRTIRASHMALDTIEALDRFNAHSRYQLKLSIGTETGAVPGGRPSQQKRLQAL